jgi:hypothetical protein
MPPSPQPDFSPALKPSLRRATSLPPEQSIRFSRPSTPTLLKLPDSEDPPSPQPQQSPEIEELSPEAIVPDEVPVLRDPEIEVPDDEEEGTVTAEAELEEKFSKILQLDRMHDGSEDGDCGEDERPVTPVRNTRKRKFTPSEEGREEEPLQKRAASPRTVSSPLRRG